jgi:hypothetical protein
VSEFVGKWPLWGSIDGFSVAVYKRISMLRLTDISTMRVPGLPPVFLITGSFGGLDGKVQRVIAGDFSSPDKAEEAFKEPFKLESRGPNQGEAPKPEQHQEKSLAKELGADWVYFIQPTL